MWGRSGGALSPAGSIVLVFSHKELSAVTGGIELAGGEFECSAAGVAGVVGWARSVQGG